MAASDASLGHYDCAIIGTGLTESILAAALSKAGRTVIHLDEKPYYGSREASLSLHELIEWAASEPSASYSFPAFDTMSLPAEIAQLSRQCALSLAPSLVPAVGDFIDALVRAGVSRYTGFRLLDAVVVGDREGGKKRVPASKEDVFKDRGLSLPDKRRLMKFLLLAAGDFESNEAIHGHGNEAIEDFLTRQMGLTGDLLKAVMHAVALCSTPRDPTMPTLQRLRSYLRASGRYGNSPFLIGQYGGAGELAQGFCRVCAVFGGTFVLGRPIDSIDRPGQVYRIKLGDDLCTADQLIASASSASASLIHRAIILIDAPIKLAVPAASTEAEEGEATEKQADSALFVFPPATFDGQEAAIQALMVGESAFACPAGQYVLYLATPALNSTDAKAPLQPALASLLTDSQRILFSLFYTETSPATATPNDGRLHVDRQLSSNFADLPQAAVAEAHRLFKLIVGDETGTELFSSSTTSQEEDD